MCRPEKYTNISIRQVRSCCLKIDPINVDLFPLTSTMPAYELPPPGTPGDRSNISELIVYWHSSESTLLIPLIPHEYIIGM